MESLSPFHPHASTSQVLMHNALATRLARRTLLGGAALAGLHWLTPIGSLLARAAEESKPRGAASGEPAQSVILVWLAGGASQLETFDPKPGAKISGGTQAIHTKVKGIQLAKGLEQFAEQMDVVSIVRSVTSPEGDHERGTMAVKTGYRPQAPDIYPSIGAILCHELPDQCSDLPFRTEIPRHISILPGQWPGHGGFFGAQYDAFKSHDPRHKVPDVVAQVSQERFEQRMEDLSVVEKAFARRRSQTAGGTRHLETVRHAETMMTSKQLEAFDITQESTALQASYGDTPFGRALLAARRLTEVGARCVEVTLNGWDSHARNHEIHKSQLGILDPALAALLRDLRERDQLKRTVVVVMGEFGRTPKINPLEGRDHWPHGFSIALAGGNIRGGQVIGETDPEGGKELAHPVKIAQIHATILKAVGLDPKKENISPAQRPVSLADGDAIEELLEPKA